jgi:hypothetical protein
MEIRRPKKYKKGFNQGLKEVDGLKGSNEKQD